MMNFFFKEIKILKLNQNGDVEEIISGSDVIFSESQFYIQNVTIIPILKKEQLIYLPKMTFNTNLKRSTIVEKTYSNKNFVKQLEQNNSIYSLIRLLIKNDKGKNIAEDENSVKTSIYGILRMPIIVIIMYLISIKSLIKPIRNKNKIFGIMKIALIIFSIYISLSIIDNISIKKMSSAFQLSFVPSVLLLIVMLLVHL